MSHYAKVGTRQASIIVAGVQTQIEGGLVDQVIVAEADFFNHFVDTSPGKWIQTSYNTKGNVHYGADGNPDDGVAVRGNYAGIDFIYDSINDVFYSQQPYPSWLLNQDTWTWNAPVPMPKDGKIYAWDEHTKDWNVIDVSDTPVQTLP